MKNIQRSKFSCRMVLLVFAMMVNTTTSSFTSIPKHTSAVVDARISSTAFNSPSILISNVKKISVTNTMMNNPNNMNTQSEPRTFEEQNNNNECPLLETPQTSSQECKSHTGPIVKMKSF